MQCCHRYGIWMMYLSIKNTLIGNTRYLSMKGDMYPKFHTKRWIGGEGVVKKRYCSHDLEHTACRLWDLADAKTKQFVVCFIFIKHSNISSSGVTISCVWTRQQAVIDEKSACNQHRQSLVALSQFFSTPPEKNCRDSYTAIYIFYLDNKSSKTLQHKQAKSAKWQSTLSRHLFYQFPLFLQVSTCFMHSQSQVAYCCWT